MPVEYQFPFLKLFKLYILRSETINSSICYVSCPLCYFFCEKYYCCFYGMVCHHYVLALLINLHF